jgi:hypothetical protein
MNMGTYNAMANDRDRQERHIQRLEAQRDQLAACLRALVQICDKANIPLVSAHAVRDMGKFMDAHSKAKTLLAALDTKGDKP